MYNEDLPFYSGQFEEGNGVAKHSKALRSS